MELRSRTEALFNRFTQTGSLGAFADRSPLSFTEKAEAASYPLASDMLVSYDNVAGLDKDDRAGFVRFERQSLEKRMSGEIDQSFAELIGPTPDLDEATKARMREEMQEMVANGVLTQEELEKMLAGAAAEPPKNGQVHGSLEKTGDTLRAAIETSGDDPDIEYILSNSQGFSVLTISPTLDGFTAQAIHVDHSSETNSYKETFSGDWNLIGG